MRAALFIIVCFCILLIVYITYNLMRARSLPGLLLEFASNSERVAVTGFLVRILAAGFLPHLHSGKSSGQMHPLAEL